MALDRLEPRNASEILSSMWALYREYFSPILAIVVVVEVPWTFITSVVQWWASNTLAPPRAPEDPLTWGWDMGVSLVLALLGGLLSLIVLAALARAVARHQVGQDVGIGEAYSFALAWAWPILGAGFIASLVVVGAAATLVGVPVAVYFLVSWLFLSPVIMFEGRGATEALGRSAALVKGYWWRTLGVLLFTFLIVTAVSLPLGALASLIGSGNTFLQSLLLGLLLVPLAPILPLVVLFMYYDLRVRKEGFTLAQLAFEVDAAEKE